MWESKILIHYATLGEAHDVGGMVGKGRAEKAEGRTDAGDQAAKADLGRY
jgi:hypothetical protein